jgi:hypothetical protein
MDRDSLSRRDFAGTVREHMNVLLEAGGHHPGERYTPLAFRHYIRRIALLSALEHVPFRTALDVGCAEGFFMRALRDGRQADVWGIDISNVAVEKLHRATGMRAAAADATRLPFADGSFDLVYSTEVIEHVLDPEVMLAEMRRVSRGIVLVTTPVSATAYEHEPDYALEHEGHVNNFDRVTVERIFGPDARLGSFRCNASLALIVAVGRRLPSPLRDVFYSFDHAMSAHVGAPDHRLKPLRNRDWLITVRGRGAGDGQPAWSCPGCHDQLIVGEGVLSCEKCDNTYRVGRGVPDFFSADLPIAPARP